MRLRSLAHSDVPNGGRHQNPLGARERAEHDLDGKLTAVLATTDQLDAGADLLRQRLGGTAMAIGDQAFREARGDDVAHRLAQQLVAGIAELRLGPGVQQHDAAGLVDHDHRVRRCLEKPSVSGSGFRALNDTAHEGELHFAFSLGHHLSIRGASAARPRATVRGRST